LRQEIFLFAFYGNWVWFHKCFSYW
jgi:hypothetical protein